MQGITQGDFGPYRDEGYTSIQEAIGSLGVDYTYIGSTPIAHLENESRFNALISGYPALDSYRDGGFLGLSESIGALATTFFVVGSQEVILDGDALQVSLLPLSLAIASLPRDQKTSAIH